MPVRHRCATPAQRPVRTTAPERIAAAVLQEVGSWGLYRAYQKWKNSTTDGGGEEERLREGGTRFSIATPRGEPGLVAETGLERCDDTEEVVADAAESCSRFAAARGSGNGEETACGNREVGVAAGPGGDQAAQKKKRHDKRMSLPVRRRCAAPVQRSTASFVKIKFLLAAVADLRSGL